MYAVDDDYYSGHEAITSMDQLTSLEFSPKAETSLLLMCPLSDTISCSSSEDRKIMNVITNPAI